MWAWLRTAAEATTTHANPLSCGGPNHLAKYCLEPVRCYKWAGAGVGEGRCKVEWQWRQRPGLPGQQRLPGVSATCSCALTRGFDGTPLLPALCQVQRPRPLCV